MTNEWTSVISLTIHYVLPNSTCLCYPVRAGAHLALVAFLRLAILSPLCVFPVPWPAARLSGWLNMQLSPFSHEFEGSLVFCLIYWFYCIPSIWYCLSMSLLCVSVYGLPCPLCSAILVSLASPSLVRPRCPLMFSSAHQLQYAPPGLCCLVIGSFA